MGKTGRRRGDSGTRQAILDAARDQFGKCGYDATTIRAIAATASVDPALVMHFFRSKDGLFAACVRWPFDPTEELPRLLANGPEGIGEALVRLFVRTWDQEAGRNPIVALLRAAMTQESAERLLREFVTNELLVPLARSLNIDNALLRASLGASQLLGLGIARYVLRVEPLATIDAEIAVACIAPAVQAHLTGPLPALSEPRHGRWT